MADDTSATRAEHKALTAFEIKDAAKGEVEAVVATLGVVDRDEDIIRKDAIASGAQVAMSGYGHDAVFGTQPVGKGTLAIDGNRVVFKGRIFLATAAGRDTFEVLKEMGAQQEWSFGFRVLGSEVPSEAEQKQGARRILTKLDAFEVSPVIMGAGIGTRTLAVKAAAAPQADGADDPPADATPEPAPLVPAPVVTEAEAKAAKDAEMLQAMAEAQAAIDLARRANAEFERMQRTMRRYSA